MVSNRDLLLGVERGIITQAQLAQLVSIASDVREEQTPPDLQQNALREAEDEAPRFIRSFGDLFIAIGTGFLGAGLVTAVSYMGNSAEALLAALTIIWLTAEWLTGYLRISAPSIVLAILFTGFAVYFVLTFYNMPMLSGMIIQSGGDEPLMIGLSSMAAAGLFYLRFRLPFALAIFGLTTVFMLIAIIGTISSDFLLTNFRWIIGLGGLGLFGVAMWFDFKDPLRNSRRSDCGFWLHLIAAPMVTHAILWDSHPAITNLQKMLGAAPTTNSWLIIAAFFILFGIIALIINRRALLVASLGYVGSVIAYGIWQLNLPAGATTSVILLIIALLILTFGVGWKPLRRLVFLALPQGKYLDNLPPVHG